ncbi:unnamed protein product (macronuclear) [Paramecium tetraurelia]|uniref:Chromosome undetermined scaffold_52, whole genome shotgun sequence n=1 Tax=Paramecium tetraurelia TaxID=5888 RepID=A0DJ12_PARTE|nr:uncharacterized protein GSPATT00017386001 [Paramecium tetraurelia]XP_001453013.1 uncharacterized protein GSPATT00019333001 [Paramecium tetraurelia]CAK83029.1 unnamed protein product [Paramecium tetraurelia]CAK85616.1 unnamed protein product [Paramecium tetraurelia]|eukprot:XP_001450426.1 hypothetical protein (macronuclear) [Paramecium tetraurelia strain d4-2]
MSTPSVKSKLVQTFGRKKNAVASASVREGKGIVKVNGAPIELVNPAPLRQKALEPLLLLGQVRTGRIDIRVTVRGGGTTAQIYAIRQAISKGIVAYYQKYIDETQKREIKDLLLQYDRTLLVADPRRCEPRKYGGKGARARRQKSYR